MQRIFAPARSGAVHPLRLTLVSAALGLGNPLLDVPVKMSGLESLTVARRNGGRDTEIQSHFLNARNERGMNHA